MEKSRKAGRANCDAGQKKTPSRNGYRYRQQFGIVVICENEEAQERAYGQLQRAGFRKLRVVTV